MANNVSVTFSAQIGQLISGVDQVKEAIASIAAPVNAMASVFTGFGEAFAGAFAVSQVAEFISQMEELGTKTVRSAAMLGVSTTEAQQLGFIAKATGGDTESLALSMERLQVNLQKAQSGAGPAAQALQALGLSAKSLIGLPLEEQLNRIADAVSKFADGGNKTAIVMDLLGRGGAQMIPVLDKGRAGLEELRDAALSAGVVMSKETVEGLDRAGTAAVTLRASITGLGEAIVGRFSKQLIEASDSRLTTFAADMAALVQTSHLGEAAIAELGAGVRIAGANIESLALTMAYAITGQWGEAVKAWRAGNAEILRIQKETDDQVLLQAAKLRLALGMNLKFGGGGTNDKPQAPPLAVPNKDALSAQMEQFQTQIKLADAAYKQTQEKLTAEYKLHDITYSQETQALIAALNQRFAAENSAIDGEMALYAKGTAGYQKALDERKLLTQKYNADLQKLQDLALQKSEQDWQKALQPIQGAFNSQLRSLLSGTETWGQAMKKIFGDVVIQAIEEFEKLAIIDPMIKSLSHAFDIADLAASFTKMITGALGPIFAGMTANLAPTLGPAAVPTAAGITAAVEGISFGLSKFDIGTDSILRTGLAIVHEGEEIKPAVGSGPYTGANNSGGDIHFHVTAIDAASIQKFFQQNGNQIARSLQSRSALTPSAGWA